MQKGSLHATRSRKLHSGAVSYEQREKAAHRPFGACFDLLGLGHRQHSEQSSYLLVADDQAYEGVYCCPCVFEL